MKALVAFLAFILIPLGTGFPQDAAKQTGEEGRIIALESAWNHAEQSKDVAALAQLLGDKFIYVDYDGTLMNKSQFLESAKSAAVTSEQIINEGVSVQIYGNAAVSTGTYWDKGLMKGKAFSRHGRFIDTWIHNGGTWQCVASQSTLISH